MTKTSVVWITGNARGGSSIVDGCFLISPPGRPVRLAYVWAFFCLMFVAIVGIPRKAL